MGVRGPYLTLLREDAGQRGCALRDVFDALPWVIKTGAQCRTCRTTSGPDRPCASRPGAGCRLGASSTRPTVPGAGAAALGGAGRRPGGSCSSRGPAFRGTRPSRRGSSGTRAGGVGPFRRGSHGLARTPPRAGETFAVLNHVTIRHADSSSGRGPHPLTARRTTRGCLGPQGRRAVQRLRAPCRDQRGDRRAREGGGTVPKGSVTNWSVGGADGKPPLVMTTAARGRSGRQVFTPPRRSRGARRPGRSARPPASRTRTPRTAPSADGPGRW